MLISLIKKPLMLLFQGFFIVFFYSCSVFTYYGKIDKKFHKLDSSWNLVENDTFKIFFLEGSLASKNKNTLLKQAKIGLLAAHKNSENNIKFKPLKLFIVDNPDQIEKYTNDRNNGNAYIKSNVIIQKYDMLQRSHEYFHILSIQYWGYSYSWIEEGSAVWSDGHWRNNDLHKYSKLLYKSKKLIPLKELFKKNSFKKYPSAVTYPQSGSVVKYLIDTYGKEKFLLLWKSKNIFKIYNKSIEDIEKDWLEYINKI